MERIAFHVACRCQGQVKAEVIVFSKEQGILGETREAGDMLQMSKGGEDER